MKAYLLRLPDDLHTAAKVEAARQGLTINQLLITSITAALIGAAVQGMRADLPPKEKGKGKT